MVDVYTVKRTLHVPVVDGNATTSRTCEAVRLITAPPDKAGVLKVAVDDGSEGGRPYYTSPPLATLGMPAAALDAKLATMRAQFGSLARIDGAGMLTIDGCEADESAAYAVPRAYTRPRSKDADGDWRRVAPLTMKDVHDYEKGVPVDVGMRARTVYALCLPPKASDRKPRMQILYRLLERARVRARARLNLEKSAAARKHLKLNVLILGVDSAGQWEFFHRLPRTRAVLEELAAGHNQLALSYQMRITQSLAGYTDPNLVAWATGSVLRYIFWFYSPIEDYPGTHQSVPI